MRTQLWATGNNEDGSLPREACHSLQKWPFYAVFPSQSCSAPSLGMAPENFPMKFSNFVAKTRFPGLPGCENHTDLRSFVSTQYHLVTDGRTDGRTGTPSIANTMQVGRQKSRFWANIWHHRVLSTLRPARCYQHGAAGPWQVVTLIAGSKRRSLLMAGDDDKMFMTKSLNVTPATTEQHLSVRSNKSVYPM